MVKNLKKFKENSRKLVKNCKMEFKSNQNISSFFQIFFDIYFNFIQLNCQILSFFPNNFNLKNSRKIPENW